jgi:DNA-binding transcriptional ArsR family regulator
MVHVENNKTEKLCNSLKSLSNRELISIEEANELVMLFKLLSNDTRLRMIHALVLKSEMCVTELANELGMKPQAVSNQLQKLLDKGIVKSIRKGNNILYKIADPCLLGLLEQGLCIIEEEKKDK